MKKYINQMNNLKKLLQKYLELKKMRVIINHFNKVKEMIQLFN